MSNTPELPPPPPAAADIARVEGSVGDETQELERALRLTLPSLRDHRLVATTLRMILRKRGFDVWPLPSAPRQAANTKA